MIAQPGPNTSRIHHAPPTPDPTPAASPAPGSVSGSGPVVLDTTGRVLPGQVREWRSGPDAVLVTLPAGISAYAVTKGSIARALLTDPRVTRDPGHWPGFDPDMQPGWLVPWTTVSMFNTAGGDHTRLRRLVSKGFTHRRVQSLRPAITAIVDERLTHLASIHTEQPGKPIDLRAEFTYAIPVNVICDLVGVPTPDRARTARIMENAINTSLPPDQAAANSEAMIDTITGLITHKRAHPGDDLTTRLITIHDDNGDHLSERELVATLILLVGAGSETTVSLIDHTITALAADPAALAAVRADPDRWDDAIEETLRHTGPAMFLPLRYTSSDISLPDGTRIPAGHPIIIGFAPHGRDPQLHDHPDTWDLDRTDHTHLAFGHGIHHCLGAPLARLEARIALQHLYDRYDITINPDHLQPQPTFIGNDYQAVPATLTPR